MAQLSIALLGPVQVSIGDVAVTNFTHAKVRALLVYLAAERNHAHERDALAELLWPDQPPQVGRNSLRQALALLRRIIGDHNATPPLLLISRERVQLNPASDHTLDLAHYDALLAAGARHQHQPPAACATCVEQWERAVALYRGPFASGAAPRDSQGFEEWAHARREALAQQHLDTLTRLADYYEAQGEYERTLHYARQQIEHEAWRESAYRQAMRALAAQGQRGAALAVYEQCRRVLAEELGIAPEDETTALYEQLRGAAQPVATAAQAVTTLPLQPTSFVGRSSELAALETMLARPDVRLITLLGPGGIGKTRLALQLAERVAAQFPHGVRWVALAPLTTSEEMLDELARSLAVPEGASDRRAALREAVRNLQVLLVVDNAEHIMAGVDLLAELLASAPQLRMVVTSRERLQLRSEWLYDLEGLPYAPHGAANEEDSPAVALLLERARQVRNAITIDHDERVAMAQIARAVEGNPLALELAAAARRNRPFSAIAAAIQHDLDLLRVSLRDLPERHRSIRATLAYSWRLLSSVEQTTLVRLSIFRGGLTLEGAHQVAAADALLLEGLVDKSVLRRQNERFDLHELVRRFANEQLVASGQAEATNQAHLAYAVAFAEAAEPQLSGSDQGRWLHLIAQEHNNLRAALGWAIEHGRDEEAQRLSAALTRFWWMHGHQREGRQWLQRALELAGPATTLQQQAVRARALHGAGGLALQQSEYPLAHTLLTESLALERVVGRTSELVRLLNNLALTEINLGAYDVAQQLLEECLALDQAQGDTRGVAFDLGSLGQMAFFQGDNLRAVELYDQSVVLHRQVDDLHSVAIGLLNVGGALRILGRSSEARERLEESLLLFRKLDAAYGVAFALMQLAQIAVQQGAVERARALAEESLPLLAALDHTGALVLGLALLAELELAAGDLQRGARLWGAAVGLSAGKANVIEAAERPEYERNLARAHALIAQHQLLAAWEEGRALHQEQAVAYALHAKRL